MGETPPPLTLRQLAAAVLGDLRRSLAVLVVYETLFKLLSALVLVPALAALLFHLVRAQGRTAMTNDDILAFLLSPAGVCYGYLLGLKVLGLAMLEHAGAMALAALKHTGHWHGVRQALVVLAMRATRVLRLAGLIVVLLTLAMAPFALAAALAYRWLLGGQDINYYLAVRPPRFYFACLIGGALLLSAAALAAWLYVRWAFSLPVLLFEDAQPIPALRPSARRTAGGRWRLAGPPPGWVPPGPAPAAQAAALAGFKPLAGGLLTATGYRPSVVVPETLTLLVVKGVVLAAVSALFVAVQALLILRLYVERGVRVGELDRAHWGDALED